MLSDLTHSFRGWRERQAIVALALRVARIAVGSNRWP